MDTELQTDPWWTDIDQQTDPVEEEAPNTSREGKKHGSELGIGDDGSVNIQDENAIEDIENLVVETEAEGEEAEAEIVDWQEGEGDQQDNPEESKEEE